MKFLPLIWAGLWRRPARTIFTGLSVAIAFVLFGLLQGVNAGFTRAIARAHRESLVVNTRVRGGAPLPIASMEQIKRIPGIKEVAPRAYFTGNARGADPGNYIAALATVPDIFFHVTAPNSVTSKANLAAMRETRSGMLVTPPLLEQFGWKIGDTIPLQSDIVKIDGSQIWTFQIIGTLQTPNAPTKSYFAVINYDYFNSYRAANRDTAEMFYVLIADPTKAIATGAAIDRIFANSSHETHTRSMQQRAEYQAKQLGDVALFTDAIMIAVIFTLAFVTGNTLRQSLQQRTPEFAVLKTVGYSSSGVLLLAFTEALCLCMPPAMLGLALAYALAPLARADIGSIVISPLVVLGGLSCAALLALLGSALPASRLARMSIVSSLGKR
jgi:putative ABC transport system permease protein